MTKSAATLAVLLLAGAAAASAVVASSSFLGAPPGVPVAMQPVNLPPVKFRATFAVAPPHLGAFSPTFDDLVSGETVITTNQQMKEVWERLFAPPYDPSAFDFTNRFVVLMGGGAMSIGSFGISSAERVDASWWEFGFLPGGAVTNAFLAVTSTTFIGGAFPQDPPPPTYRLDAVSIDRSELDDVVFHRAHVFAP